MQSCDFQKKKKKITCEPWTNWSYQKKEPNGVSIVFPLHNCVKMFLSFYKISSFYKLKQFQNQFVHLLLYGSVYLYFTVHLVWPNVGHFLRGTYVTYYSDKKTQSMKVESNGAPKSGNDLWRSSVSIAAKCKSSQAYMLLVLWLGTKRGIWWGRFFFWRKSHCFASH